MRKILILSVLLSAVVFSCSRSPSATIERLDRADMLMPANTDLSLAILDSLGIYNDFV